MTGKDDPRDHRIPQFDRAPFLVPGRHQFAGVLRGSRIEAGSKLSRSAFIEHVLRNYFRERARRKLHARDLERINAAADRLNAEAAEVLDYQAAED